MILLICRGTGKVIFIFENELHIKYAHYFDTKSLGGIQATSFVELSFQIFDKDEVTYRGLHGQSKAKNTLT